MKNFTATIEGSTNGNRKIQGVSINMDSGYNKLILLFNALNRGDWGYENTPLEMKRLGIKDTHGYTHHWLYPSRYITNLEWTD